MDGSWARAWVWIAVAAASALAACPAGPGGQAVEPVAPGPQVSIVPVGPDPQALYDGFTPEHPRRAVLGRVDDAKIALDDDWNVRAEGGVAADPVELLIADERPEAVRVVGEWGALRVAMWVRPEDLRVVPTERVVFSPAPDESVAGDGPSVQLAPGVPAEVVERKDGWVLFELGEPEVRASGWVRETRVGRVFVRHDFNVSFEIADLEPAAGTEIHDCPDGIVLAVLRPDEGAVVRVKGIGEEEGGWREVLYATPVLRAMGWVRADRLAEVEEGAPAAPGGGAAVSDAGGGGGVHLAAGTELRWGPGGEVFAYVARDTELGVLGATAGGGVILAVATPWGELPGWVGLFPGAPFM